MTLRAHMQNNELTIGSWLTVGHSAIAEVMAGAGFDWLVIDMEHSVIDLGTAQEMMQALDAVGVPAIVRLGGNDATLIKRVMDAGATGVMCPSVNSEDDAKRLVDAVYYPPRGRRGVGLARAQAYGAGFDAYRGWLETSAVVIAMIEHIDGVGNADAILAVDGIDGYMIGPYDLSASMGKPGRFEEADVQEAIQRVRQAGERAGKAGGIHVVDPDQALLARRIDDGFTFIGYGMDVTVLNHICREHLARARKRP